MPKRANATRSTSAPARLQTLASASGTQRYSERFRPQFVPDFFRKSGSGLTLSTLALGTYLGDSDDETDVRYAAATRHALANGVNIVDTAINYRCQRSERVVGRVLQELIGESAVRREEVVLCTKAGYVPLDGTPPGSREQYEAYLRREYFDRGLLRQTDLVGGGHAMTPEFLVDQLHRSMRNLGVQGIDYFYVHNPEQQLNAVSPAELSSRLRLAFEAL